ncbi:hypothetical protein ABH944_007212 [Caballeronia udeis]|uniref:Uncharacterized protein n=1 Tax=Caballeronia udeis TaxID=1232866 RepID=A0ABW8MTV8_9BURK
MKAIAQLKTAQILDRINALQTSTSHYFNSSQLTAPVREWLSKKLRPLIDARVKADYLIHSEVSLALATAATAGAEAIVKRVI